MQSSGLEASVRDLLSVRPPAARSLRTDAVGQRVDVMASLEPPYGVSRSPAYLDKYKEL